MHSVTDYSDALLAELETAAIPSGITTEKEFEVKVIVPIALRVAESMPTIQVATHPWNSTARCTPSCEGAGSIRVPGCKKCWASSKRWGAVTAFGTKNNFDLVARDRDNQTMALEAKWVKWGKEGSKAAPSGELQRFFGQCLLAAAKHRVTVGVFGVAGLMDPDMFRDNDAVKEICSRCNIKLLFRESVPSISR